MSLYFNFLLPSWIAYRIISLKAQQNESADGVDQCNLGIFDTPTSQCKLGWLRDNKSYLHVFLLYINVIISYSFKEKM